MLMAGCGRGAARAARRRSVERMCTAAERTAMIGGSFGDVRKRRAPRKVGEKLILCGEERDVRFYCTPRNALQYHFSC